MSEYALIYVKKQTPMLCLEAVKKNGMSLQFVREQTDEICLEAVKQNEFALRYVKERTCAEYIIDKLYGNINIDDVRKNHDIFKFLKDQTEEICIEIVKKMACRYDM